LKKLLIFIVICAGVWQLFLKDSALVGSTFSNTGAIQTLAKASEVEKPKAHYQCDGRQHCSQMNSYEEAEYFIQHCPNTKMDGDNDGVPCERQFNR